MRKSTYLCQELLQHWTVLCDTCHQASHEEYGTEDKYHLTVIPVEKSHLFEETIHVNTLTKKMRS